MSGYPIPRKKNRRDIPKVKDPKKIPNPGEFAKSRGFRENAGDKNPEIKKIPNHEIKIPILKNIPNPVGQKTVTTKIFLTLKISKINTQIYSKNSLSRS